MRRDCMLAPAVVFITATVAIADKGDEKAFRMALGSQSGDTRFDTAYDLNADGMIDVRDVALYRDNPGGDGSVAGGGESVIVEERSLVAVPGQTVKFKLRLFNSTTPLFGYSMAVVAIPLAGATGSVSGDPAQSSFFPSRNLFLAAPSHPPLDPVFSVILPLASNGVFVNANTADGSSVTGSAGVNDILAEVAFTPSATAQGVFEIRLGQASALANGAGQAVPFGQCIARLSVGVPQVRAGDLNGDGAVNAFDLAALLSAWGDCTAATCPADINCDGVVNAFDVAALLNDWG